MSEPQSAAEIISRYKQARRNLRLDERPRWVALPSPSPPPAPPPRLLNLPDVIFGRPREIIKAVADFAKIPESSITGPGRYKEQVYWRHFAILLIRRHTRLSATQIGKLFNRDHSTVLHAINQGEQTVKLEHWSAVKAMLPQEAAG